MTGVAASAGAATPHEFYASLLQRGIASHNAGRFEDATKQLRIAAFGLVEIIDQYEIAQVYLALSYDRLNESDRAREAARRVVAAERIEPRFGGLSLPATVRGAFESIATRLLGPSEISTLRGAAVTTSVPQPTTSVPPARTATTQTTTTPPRRTTTTPQTTTPPRRETTAPATQPAQQSASTPARQTTTPENTAPQTVQPQPKPASPPPAVANPTPAKPPATTTPAVKPPQQTASATTPSTTKPAPATATTPTNTTKPATTSATQPATTTAAAAGRGGPTEPAKPAPVPATPAPRTFTAAEITSRLAAADRALGGANLNEARRAYRELLTASTLDHDTLIRVAEGLYRSRDFANALTAFSRIGTLRRGEEPYRYYIAVALYETGDIARAKKELAAALPYIEITPDVARYREKIEGAQ